MGKERDRLTDPEKLKETLAAKLAQGRNYHGFKQQWMAEQLGVDVSSYNKWEKGINQPNAYVLARIGEIENLDLNFFFQPELTPAEADLTHNQYVAPAQRAKRAIEALEQRAARSDDEDMVVKHVQSRPALYDFVSKVHQLDDITIKRLGDMLMFGLQMIRNPESFAAQEAVGETHSLPGPGQAREA